MQVGIQMIKRFDQLMGAERVRLINDRLIFSPCEIYEAIPLSLQQLKLKTPAVVKYKNIEHLFNWWYGTTHEVFYQKLIYTAVLEGFKRPFGN